MLKNIISASFFLLLFYSVIFHNNYNYHWQFVPLKLAQKWSRSDIARSQVTPCQDPGGNSPPRSTIFSWKPNCQIRLIKLYYQIILFSPTVLTNLNSSQKSKIVNRKSQIKFAQVNKMTHSNKSQKKQQRHAKRNPLMAPMGAQINNISTYHFTNLTNQTFLAGSIQAAPMEIPSEIPAGNGPTGSQAEITAPDNATGNSQEATQQASIHGDKIPAAQFHPSRDLSRISSPQLNIANSNLPCNATGNSQEATQQASIQ